MSRLFGTDGVRGVANLDLSPELAFRLGEAAGHFLGDSGAGRIVVGRDTRRSGDMIEAALVAGVCSGGADALICGVVPTPAVSHLVRAADADGGVVISASHNPAEYNGIKFLSREGFKLPDELEDSIAEFVAAENREWVRPTGAGVGRTVAVRDAADRYVQHCIRTISVSLEGLVVGLDCAHGAASVTSPEAFRQLGATVHAINAEWDGMDINAGCGSTHPQALAEAVVAHGMDLGVAHDGDADRVILVDETGGIVDGDEIMAICAARMKETGTLPYDTVVATVMSNLGFETAMRERGIHVVKTKVGDRYVLEQMQVSGASLGGEQSGHIIFMEHNTTGDGLVTALQVVSVMRETGSRLSELRKVMRRFPQVLENVAVADKGRLGANAAIANAVDEAEQRLGSRGRVLVRASGTEPLVRVMAEAEQEAAAADVVAGLAAVIRRELG